MGIILHMRPPHGGLVLEASEIMPGFSGLELRRCLLARAELQLVYMMPLNKLGKTRRPFLVEKK